MTTPNKKGEMVFVAYCDHAIRFNLFQAIKKYKNLLSLYVVSHLCHEVFVLKYLKYFHPKKHCPSQK